MTVDDSLRARLDAALDPPSASWADVVARARRERRRRRIYLRMLVAAALVIFVAAPLAIAARHQIAAVVAGSHPQASHPASTSLRRSGCSKPVPAAIAKRFEQLFEPKILNEGGPPRGVGPSRRNLVACSEHLVLSVPSATGKPIRLYAEYFLDHTYCTTSTGPGGSGGCGPLTDGAIQLGFGADVMGGGPAGPSGLLPRTYVWISGHTGDPRAAAVRVDYPQGHSETVALHEGFMVYELSPARRAAWGVPDAIVVVDRAGAEIERKSSPLDSFIHPPVHHFTTPVASTIRLLASARLGSGGGIVKIWTGRDAAGDQCLRKLRNGTTQTYPAWQCGPEVGQKTSNTGSGWSPDTPDIAWYTGQHTGEGTGAGYLYTYGWVAPAIHQLRLLFQDRTSEPIPLIDGTFFLYVLPKAHAGPGHRPTEADALDAANNVAGRIKLYPNQRCAFPYPDPGCRQLLIATG